MGQVSSSTSVSKSREKNSQSGSSKSLSNIAYTDIVKYTEELNAITRNLTGRNDKLLKFVIKNGTDRSTFVWKRKVRIQCQKLDTRTHMIVSSRTLTLRQFLEIHREITDWVAALTLRFEANSTSKNHEQAAVAASEEETSLEFSLQSVKNKESECCVCMERKACIMLSCCHEFCEICIDNWTRDEEHSNCPLCRTSVSGSDDTWVLMDKSDAKGHTSDVHSYLMRIADKRKNPVS